MATSPPSIFTKKSGSNQNSQGQGCTRQPMGVDASVGQPFGHAAADGGLGFLESLENALWPNGPWRPCVIFENRANSGLVPQLLTCKLAKSRRELDSVSHVSKLH